MTAKEALLTRVSGYSEAQASSLLQRLESEDAESGRPLTAHEIDLIKRALADSDAGRTVSIEDVEREFGLTE